MPSEDPDEPAKPRRSWPRRKRWSIIALLFIGGILAMATWNISREPQVKFIGFREKNGKRLAAFTITGPLGIADRYTYSVTIRNAQEQKWDALVIWELPPPSFSIEMLNFRRPPLTDSFQVEVHYAKHPPPWIDRFRRWLPDSLNVPKFGVIWSETITP